MSRITWQTLRECAGEIVGPWFWADTGRTGVRGGPVKERLRESVLIQTDWDYPSVATSFGWSIQSVQSEAWLANGVGPCPHEQTDGTVPCPRCELGQTDFIGAAADFLADNDGITARDPGYFS